MNAPSNAVIRKAVVVDAEICSEVFCASIRELCAKDHQNDESLIEGWLFNKTPKHIRDWIEQGPVQLFVADIDGEVVAVGGIAQPNKIEMNYISPKFTGRGISRLLMQRMEDELKESGATTAVLVSTRTAVDFYKAIGWRIAGEIQSCMTVDGYPMEKDLV